MVTGIVIVGACVVLLVLAFLLPRLSRHPQRATNRALHAGARTARKAPGSTGRLLAKPFHKSSKAANKSARAGRKGRRKMPL